MLRRSLGWKKHSFSRKIILQYGSPVTREKPNYSGTKRGHLAYGGELEKEESEESSLQEMLGVICALNHSSKRFNKITM